MLTGRSGGADKIAGLAAGADDYITKPFSPGELLARIQAHLRRSREYAAPEEEAHAITLGPGLVLDLRNRDALVQGEPAHLTDREYEVLLLLARHRGTALDKTLAVPAGLGQRAGRKHQGPGGLHPPPAPEN